MSTSRQPTDRFLNHKTRGDAWKSLTTPLPKPADQPKTDPRDIPRVESTKCKVRR